MRSQSGTSIFVSFVDILNHLYFLATKSHTSKTSLTNPLEHVLIEKNHQGQTDQTAQHTNTHFLDERVQSRHDREDTDRHVRPLEPVLDWIKSHGNRAFYSKGERAG